MNRKSIFAISSSAVLSFLLGANAHATAWGDISQSTSSVTISSASTTSPTVLRTVTVVCPKAGRLVAYASAQFGLYSPSTPGDASIYYSISRNSTAIDFSHYHLHSQYLIDGFDWSPAGMQRSDSCTSGQTVTYRFLSNRSSAGTSTYAWQPRLFVHFFDVTI